MKKTKLIWLFLIVISIGVLIGSTSEKVLNRLKLGLDLQGGFEVLYEVQNLDNSKVDKDTIKNTISALNSRINVLGVSEPNIQPEGSDRIRVQLAGVKDQSSARRILSTQAHLTFRDVNDQPMMDGSEIKSAKLSFDETNKPVVSVKLKDPNKFGEITAELASRPYPENLLVIWLDYQEGMTFKTEQQKPKDKQSFISAPQVNQVLNSEDVVIEGSFTTKEATELAQILNAGALPVKLKEIYSQSIGAHFGADALNKTTTAGIIGISFVFLFMILYYRIPGIVSVLTLTTYIYVTLLIFDWMNGVLTLPGIAALILGVGMAVDANIISYERLIDEVERGSKLDKAFRKANQRSFITILDANLTTILAGIVLFILGASAVKGFATMLILSILVSFLTSVFGTRLLMGLLVKSKLLNNKPRLLGLRLRKYTINSEVKVHRPRFSFDFVKHRKIFYVWTALFFIVGGILFGFKGLALGIDFSSGTRIEVVSDHAIHPEKLEKEFKELNYDADITISGENQNIGVAVIKGDLKQDEVEKIKTIFHKNYGQDPNINVVSPIVGKELAKNAIIAVVIASIGIILYLSLRYEFSFAVTAVLALLHDAFLMIFMFSILQIEVNLYFIAAVLTIIGYSINDTIVTFDRIIEHLKERKVVHEFNELKSIVNVSLQETLGRSINTVLTVFITALALYIFGSEAINAFCLALLIGLVTGTYSSLFIASQIWLDLKAKKLKNGPLTVYKEKVKYNTDEPII